MRNRKRRFFKESARLQRLRGGANNMVVSLVSLIAIASIAWAAGFFAGPRARIRSEVHADINRDASASSSLESKSSQSGLAPVVLPGIAVFLTPNGFEPPQITRPPGKFVLAVVPQIGSTDFSFSFDDGVGRHLRAVQVPSEQPHWADVYDLALGTYTLRESNHPEWVCQITIKQ